MVVQKEFQMGEYSPGSEAPFYIDLDGETELFKAAYVQKLPVLLKGPTGCGKTRFVTRMAHDLQRPYIIVPCHEDLSADDLVGRFKMDGTFQPGAAHMAITKGCILDLDEVAEARNDTTVIIHPLSDDRRELVVEKLGVVLRAPDNFMLVMSYNPGYQSVTKDLKQSTKQRFVAIEFGYAPRDLEMKIVQAESGVNEDMAGYLVEIGHGFRNYKGSGLSEGASTRLLINAGKLMRQGVSPLVACRAAILHPITDAHDSATRQGLDNVITSCLPK